MVLPTLTERIGGVASAGNDRGISVEKDSAFAIKRDGSADHEVRARLRSEYDRAGVMDSADQFEAYPVIDLHKGVEGHGVGGAIKDGQI